jgi:hypothetical protein
MGGKRKTLNFQNNFIEKRERTKEEIYFLFFHKIRKFENSYSLRPSQKFF